MTPPVFVGLVPVSDGLGRGAVGKRDGLNGADASAFGTGSGETRRRVHLPTAAPMSAVTSQPMHWAKLAGKNLTKKVTTNVTAELSTSGRDFPEDSSCSS